jgi:hypothetical protein
MVRALPLVLVATFLPVSAQAQPWRDAFEAGDFKAAADALHPVVAQSLRGDAPPGDPAPARTLAAMYAHGWGVDRDPVQACSMAYLSRIGAETSPLKPYERWEAQLDDAMRLVDHHCDALSREEHLTALETMVCPRFGLEIGEVTVGPHTVRIDRRGLSVVGDGVFSSPALECPVVATAGVRAIAVEAPQDALPGIGSRYFVESLDWHMVVPQNPEHEQGFELRWTLFEVTPAGVWLAASAPIAWSPSWPRPQQPVDPALTLEMVRTGHVRWRIEGRPPSRGWLLRPGSEESRR